MAKQDAEQGWRGQATPQEYVRVRLGELVREEIQPHDIGLHARVEICGPDVRLSALQVQMLTLALHELTANAASHGALKCPSGQLSVMWETWTGANGLPRLALTWK